MEKYYLRKSKKIWKIIWNAFCTCLPSGKQVDGLPLALSKDAASASWLRSGRACEHKIYKKMYAVDDIIVEKTDLNYRKVVSYYNKASMEGI